MRPLQRHYGIILTVIVVAAMIVRVLLLRRSMTTLDRYLPDDAYISLVIARSIGSGDGPRFGQYLTNGFQPLLVWLMAIPFAVAPVATEVAALDRFVRIAVGLGAVADLLCLLLLAHILRRHVGAAAALAAAFLWAMHPTVLMQSLNGLETSLGVLGLLAVWAGALRWPLDRAPLRRVLGLGVLIGVAAMARVDIFAVGVFFAIQSAAMLVRRRHSRTESLLRNAALAVGVGVGYAPWIAYSLAYCGRVIPESGPAVRFISLSQLHHQPDRGFYRLMLESGWDTVVRNAGPLEPWAMVVLSLAIVLGAVRLLLGKPLRWRGLRVLLLPLCFAATLFPAYTLHVLAPWFFPRYLFPCMVPLVAVCALGVQRGVEVMGPRRGIVVLGLVAAIAAYAFAPTLRQQAFGYFGSPGYRSLGLWARDRYAPGTVVGADQAGAIAYYAPDVRIVNLDGVVNEHAARAARERRLFDYAKAERVHDIVGWAVNFKCLEVNSGGMVLHRDLRYVTRIDDFRTWGNTWYVYRPR